MALQILCLLILVGLTVFSLLTGNDLITSTYEANYSYAQTLNGSISELELESIFVSLQLDALIQATIWIGAIAGIIILASVSVLGSGLTETGAKWIGYSIFYTSIWIILSTLSFPLIISIEYIGSLLYLLLTMVYAIGCIISLKGN